MNCPSCHTELPDGYSFCGHCGARFSSRNLQEVVADVAAISDQLRALSARLEKKDQTVLEWETSQGIVDRLEKWAKSLAFFFGIPLVLLLVTLSVIAGKSLTNLHEVAESATSTVQPIIEKAKQEAVTAKSTADSALQSSSQVQEEIDRTKGQVENLSKTARSGSTAVEQLNAVVAHSQKEVDDLHRKVVDQSAAVQQLQDSSKAVKTEQSEERLLEMYPNLGVHFVVGAAGNVIDAAQKKQGTNYISLMLPSGGDAAAAMKPKLKGIADVITQIEAEGNRVFIGNLGLQGRAGNTVGGIMGFSGNTCGNIGGIDGPCILYMSPEKKDGALALRKHFESVESIPEAQVHLVDITKANADTRELIEKSGMDYFVELKF